MSLRIILQNPKMALDEALSVIKPNGNLLSYDKFIEERATLARRFLNIVTSAVGTDINRSFNEISEGFNFDVLEDIPVMYADNYRAILGSKVR